MEKHYEESFQAQLRLDEKIAPLMEINDILEKINEVHESIIWVQVGHRFIIRGFRND